MASFTIFNSYKVAQKFADSTVLVSTKTKNSQRCNFMMTEWSFKGTTQVINILTIFFNAKCTGTKY